MSGKEKKLKFFVAIKDNGTVVFETFAMTKSEAVKQLLMKKPNLFPLVTLKNVKNISVNNN